VHVQVRGLTETKEGRLVVIALVGGTLMIVVALGNLVMAGAADSAASDVRERLRHELAVVGDEVIDRYPESADVIEAAAVEAVRGEPARVLGTARPDDGPVVVAVQSGWGWQVRCIEAELRGDAVVLTYVRPRPC
jgi:hypothetical protein